MAGKLSRSWSLTKQSWPILTKDKWLLLFSAMSDVAWLALIAVGSAMKTVLVAACYHFAQTGECPGMSDAEVVEGSFAMK